MLYFICIIREKHGVTYRALRDTITDICDKSMNITPLKPDTCFDSTNSHRTKTEKTSQFEVTWSISYIFGFAAIFSRTMETLCSGIKSLD